MVSKKCKKQREKMEFSKMKEENFKLIIHRKKKLLSSAQRKDKIGKILKKRS